MLYFLTFYYPYLITGKISYKYGKYNSIFCIIQSFSLFYIIRHLFENFKFNKKISIIIEEIGKTTFGIYLIHILINYRIYSLNIMQDIFSINACLGVFILEIGVFVVCGIITFIFRKIPVIKNFL